MSGKLFTIMLDGSPRRGVHNTYPATAGLVGVPGFEPGTSSLSGTRSNQLSYTPGIRNPAVSGLVATARLRPTGFAGHFFTSRKSGGKGVRTPDFQLAKLALSQLSYAPVVKSR